MDNMSYSPSASEYLDANDEMRRSTYLTPCQSRQDLDKPVTVTISRDNDDDSQNQELETSVEGSRLMLQGSESVSTSFSHQLEEDDQMAASVTMEMMVKQHQTQQTEPIGSTSEMGCSSVDEQDAIDEKILETVSISMHIIILL